MNINNLTKSFKYSSLLVNRNLKQFQQNFSKINLNIDLYSIWDFDIKLIGQQLFLGLDNNKKLIFLDFIPKLNFSIAPFNAKLNKISINDFLSNKEKNLIRPFNFPIENEDYIFNYISSFGFIEE